jgi:uncharacterized repeat protein (TIGR02543 family)
MKKIVSFIVFLTLLGISGCEIFLGPDAPEGRGTLSIGFGTGEGTRAVSPEELAVLRYELVLTGPDGGRVTASVSAGESFKREASLGKWRIEAEAFTPENALFGRGGTTVTVRAGTNRVRVPMKTVTPEDTVVNAFDLTDMVAAPVQDHEPDTGPIDTTQYTGTITWWENDGVNPALTVFAADTVYEAVVTLTAKTGYTFTGVAADSFTYTGATVTHGAGSGNTLTVTITFPKTGAIVYSVSFDAKGGTPPPDAQSVASGNKVTEPATMTKPGYSFDGWYTEAAFINKWDFNVNTVTWYITLYAKWE